MTNNNTCIDEAHRQSQPGGRKFASMDTLQPAFVKHPHPALPYLNEPKAYSEHREFREGPLSLDKRAAAIATHKRGDRCACSTMTRKHNYLREKNPE